MDQPLDFSVKSPSHSFGGGSDHRDIWQRDFSPHDDKSSLQHQLFAAHNHSSSRSSNKSRSSSQNGNGHHIVKDEQYFLRREKNNAAAKRSRDARRQKEEQTKQENLKLRAENENLRFTVRTLQEHVRNCPHSNDSFT